MITIKSLIRFGCVSLDEAVLLTQLGLLVIQAILGIKEKQNTKQQ